MCMHAFNKTTRTTWIFVNTNNKLHHAQNTTHTQHTQHTHNTHTTHTQHTHRNKQTNKHSTEVFNLVNILLQNEQVNPTLSSLFASDEFSQSNYNTRSGYHSWSPCCQHTRHSFEADRGWIVDDFRLWVSSSLPPFLPPSLTYILIYARIHKLTQSPCLFVCLSLPLSSSTSLSLLLLFLSLPPLLLSIHFSIYSSIGLVSLSIHLSVGPSVTLDLGSFFHGQVSLHLLYHSVFFSLSLITSHTNGDGRCANLMSSHLTAGKLWRLWLFYYYYYYYYYYYFI